MSTPDRRKISRMFLEVLKSGSPKGRTQHKNFSSLPRTSCILISILFMVYISLVVADPHGKRLILLSTDVGDVFSLRLSPRYDLEIECEPY
jgi:hypothetical protein